MNLILEPENFLALDGVVTDTFFLGDLANLSGDLFLEDSKFKFLLTICLVFFGDFCVRSLFLELNLDLFETILPVVTTLAPFLSCLLEAADRSICLEVRLVSKLLGLLRNDLDKLTLLLAGLVRCRAGGCMEAPGTDPWAEDVDLWDLMGEKRLSR